MDNWSKIEFVCAKNLHLDPFVIRDMEFWAVEKMLENYEEFAEEEKRQYDKQKGEQEKDSKQQMPSMSQSSMPKFDMPRFEMPKFNMNNL